MRQFSRSTYSPSAHSDETEDENLAQLLELNKTVASALDMGTCFKPEVSIMLELYEASRANKSLTVSVLGLLDGIAPTTTLRYLDMLQKKGAVRRVAHESDNRMSYVELTSDAKLKIERALRLIETG